MSLACRMKPHRAQAGRKSDQRWRNVTGKV